MDRIGTTWVTAVVVYVLLLAIPVVLSAFAVQTAFAR